QLERPRDDRGGRAGRGYGRCAGRGPGTSRPRVRNGRRRRFPGRARALRSMIAAARSRSSPNGGLMRRKSSFLKAMLLATCALTTLVLVPASARGEGTLTLYCSPQIEWCQLVI